MNTKTISAASEEQESRQIVALKRLMIDGQRRLFVAFRHVKAETVCPSLTLNNMRVVLAGIEGAHTYTHVVLPGDT